MSVLVKGMGMPKNCTECPVALSGKYCRINQTYTTYIKLPIRPDHCPLIEFPEHHGRLIDADELKELFRETIAHIAQKEEMSGVLEHMVRASAMVVQMIGDAETVIEAEGGRNE